MSENTGPSGSSGWRELFIQHHELPEGYRAFAQLWFDPLVAEIALRQNGAGRPLVVGLNGSQGSGKTTLGEYLVAALAALHEVPAFNLSLDDVYLPKSDRLALADSVHPLLRTRGVPGTHDLALLESTLDALADPAAFPLPVVGFDKSSDDRQPEADWRVAQTAPRVIILEGWCLGARPQAAGTLETPVNALESNEDSEGTWRHYVNDALAGFAPIYERVDYWAMLAAPSFDCVLRWRAQQEAQLARLQPGGGAIMDRQALARFVQHFQRLTDYCLRYLPQQVDYLLELDEERQVLGCRLGGERLQ